MNFTKIVFLMAVLGEISFAGWCYQEFANQSICSNPGLGGYGDNTGWARSSSTYDGNYSTGGGGFVPSDGILYINYTPYYYNSLIWQIKDFYTFANYTIPAWCTEYNPNLLQLGIEQSIGEDGRTTIITHCYNGTWGTIESHGGSVCIGNDCLFEEGLWINNTNNVSFITNVSSCMNISNNNTYLFLNQSLSSTNNCMNISGKNITIDCQGNSIKGVNVEPSYGIYSTGQNTIIKNCRISNFTTGIKLASISSGSISNTSVNITGGCTICGFPYVSDAAGIDLDGTQNINVTNVSVASSGMAVDVWTYFTGMQSQNNSVTNSYLYSDAWNSSSAGGSCYIRNSSTNTITNNSNFGTIQISFVSLNNRIFNNTVKDYGTWIGHYGSLATGAGADSNTFLNNNVTGNNWVYNGGSGTVFNDSSTGNKYYLSTGLGAWTLYNIQDTDGNKYADIGTSLPFNSTTVGAYWTGGGGDWHPYTEYNQNQINSISVLPTNAWKNTSLLFCQVNTTTAVSPTNVTINWYKNGVNQTALASSYVGLVSGVLTNVSNITNASFSSLENWSCSAMTYDGTSYSAWAIASNITILNTPPAILYNNSFMNNTTLHSFNVSAGINDIDNFSDIISTNISTTLGICAYKSNLTNGNYFNVTYNCSSTIQGSASIIIGFTDRNGSYIETPSSSNSYPSFPKLTKPNISTANITVLSILNCTNGSFSDVAGDTENVSNRTWAWRQNGTIVAGQNGQQLNLQAINTSKNDNFSCTETTGGNNWTSFQVSNTSANVTVGNSAPSANTPASTFITSDSIVINCTATDPNGGTDIAFTNLTSTGGTLTRLVNGTSGTAFWQSWNITGLFSQTSVNVSCFFNDSSGASAASSNVTFTTTNGDSIGSETQYYYATNNNYVTWSQTYTTVGASHMCQYAPQKTDYTNQTALMWVQNNVNTTMVFNANTTSINWTCIGTGSPYTIFFTTQLINVTQQSVASSGLGNNAVVYYIARNSTPNIQMNFTGSFPSDATNIKLWRCSSPGNFSTCDAGNPSLWVQGGILTTNNGSSIIFTPTPFPLVLVDAQTVFATTNDGTAGSTGGGGGSVVIQPPPANQNITIIGAFPGADQITQAISEFLGSTYNSLKQDYGGIKGYNILLAAFIVIGYAGYEGSKRKIENLWTAISAVSGIMIIAIFYLVG